MKERGLTIVEMLVALSLLSVALAGAQAIYFGGIKSFTTGAVDADVRQHARIAAEELVNELILATELRVDQARQIVTYKKKVGNEERQYTFYLQNRQLLHGLPGGTAVPVAQFIDSFRAEPNGTLGGGGLVCFSIMASDQGCRVEVRCSVKPRNLR